MKTIFLSILLAIASLTSWAQADENWDTYMIDSSKSSGIIVLDMALRSKAPVKGQPYILTTGVISKNCTPEGFPRKEEYEKLNTISDSLEYFLKRTVANTLAGTFTLKCKRLDYFFVADTTNLRDSLAAIYSNNFSDYENFIEIKTDSSWTTYNKFLYPTELMREYMNNQKLALKIYKRGDMLKKPRRVDHTLYFSSEKDRKQFIAYAKKNRFKVGRAQFLKDKRMPYELQVSRTDKVDVASISKVTLQLKRNASKYHGVYDKWDTSVIKELEE